MVRRTELTPRGAVRLTVGTVCLLLLVSLGAAVGVRLEAGAQAQAQTTTQVYASSGASLSARHMTMTLTQTGSAAAAAATAASTSTSQSSSQSKASSQTQEQSQGRGQSEAQRGPPQAWTAFETKYPAGTYLAPFTAEEDCAICRQWMQSAVAWLPVEFSPVMLQTVLRSACNDTWIIHWTKLEMTTVGFDSKKLPADHTAPNLRRRCEQIHDADVTQEALFTVWTMFDELYPLGALPDAVCCRLERCPCAAMGARTSKWYGPPAVQAPSYPLD